MTRTHRFLRSMFVPLALIACIGCKPAPKSAGAPLQAADAGAPPEAVAPRDAEMALAEPEPEPGPLYSPKAPPPGEPIPPEERARLAGLIAFSSEREGKPRLTLIRPDGTGERAAGPEGHASFPIVFSRDGRELLAVEVKDEREVHVEQLAVYPLPKGAPRKLGPAALRARAASFTPDGRSIVFESSAGAEFAEIFRIGRDGKNLLRLTQNREGNFEPSVSPRGDRVVFVSSRDGDSELYSMTLAGEDETRLTELAREDMAPSWSPAGKKIVFVSTREGTDRLFLMNPDGTEPERVHPAPARVTTEGRVEESWEAHPAWSPDGQRLVYTVSLPGQKPRLWLKELASGKVSALTDGRARDEAATFSPDGKYLAFVSDRGGDTDLWVMRADGTGAFQLTTAKGADWRPVWGATKVRAKRPR